MEVNSKGTVKWIVGLCVMTMVAIIGWTTTASLSQRLKVIEEIRLDAVQTQANVAANNVRLSVLENKYDTIATQLAEIKALLTTHVTK